MTRKTDQSSRIRCIGTYHKTGTVWMQHVFNTLSHSLDMGFAPIGRLDAWSGEIRPGIFYLQDHCEFSPRFYAHPVSGVRIIRDPRDVVISGAHYHCRSDEDWLHERASAPNSKSYSECINELDNWDDRYLFELRMVGGQTIRQMTDADGNAEIAAFIEANFLTVRYEDLIGKDGLTYFGRICSKLDIPFDQARPAFLTNSILNDTADDVGHVRSGAIAQWRRKFSRRVADEFAKYYQPHLERLGYEKDRSWLEHLTR